MDVPLPLRSYPPPPTLASQSGAQTHQQTSNLQEAKLWDYAFAYEHQHAAQDTTYLTITFNEVRGRSGAGPGAAARSVPAAGPVYLGLPGPEE